MLKAASKNKYVPFPEKDKVEEEELDVSESHSQQSFSQKLEINKRRKYEESLDAIRMELPRNKVSFKPVNIVMDMKN